MADGKNVTGDIQFLSICEKHKKPYDKIDEIDKRDAHRYVAEVLK